MPTKCLARRGILAAFPLCGLLLSGPLAAQARLDVRELGKRPVAGVDIAKGTTTEALSRLERDRKIARYVVGSGGEGSEKRAWLRVLGIREGPFEAADFWFGGSGINSRVLAVVRFPRAGTLPAKGGWQAQVAHLGVKLARMHGVSTHYGDLYSTDVANLFLVLDGDEGSLSLTALLWAHDPAIWQAPGFQTVEQLARRRAEASRAYDSVLPLPTADVSSFALEQRFRFRDDQLRTVDGITVNLGRDVTGQALTLIAPAPLTGPAAEQARRRLSEPDSFEEAWKILFTLEPDLYRRDRAAFEQRVAEAVIRDRWSSGISDRLRHPLGARQWRVLWDAAMRDADEPGMASARVDTVMWALVRLGQGTEAAASPPITEADLQGVVLQRYGVLPPRKRAGLVRDVLQYMANRNGKGNVALGWSFVPRFLRTIAATEIAEPDLVPALESILRVMTHPPSGTSGETLVPDSLLAPVFGRFWDAAGSLQRPRMWTLAYALMVDSLGRKTPLLPATLFRRITEELVGVDVDAGLAGPLLDRIIARCGRRPLPAALDGPFLQRLHRAVWDRSSTHGRTRLLRGAGEFRQRPESQSACRDLFTDAYLATLTQEFGRGLTQDLAAGEHRLQEVLSFLEDPGSDGGMPQAQGDQLLLSVWNQLTFDQRVEIFRALEGSRVSAPVRDRVRREMADTLLARSRQAETDGRPATAAALADLAGTAGGPSYQDARRIRGLLMRLAPQFWLPVEVRGEGAAGRQIFRPGWQGNAGQALGSQDWRIVADSARARGREPVRVTLEGPIDLALRAEEASESVPVEVRQQVDAYTPAYLTWVAKVDQVRARIARLQRSVATASALGEGMDIPRVVNAQSTTIGRDSAGLAAYTTHWQMDFGDRRHAYALAFARMYQNDLDAAYAELERLELERPTPSARVTQTGVGSYTRSSRVWRATGTQRVSITPPYWSARAVSVSGDWRTRQVRITGIPAGATVTAMDQWRDEAAVRPLALRGVTEDLDLAIREQLAGVLNLWAAAEARGYGVGLVAPGVRHELIADEERWAEYWFARGEPPIRLMGWVPRAATAAPDTAGQAAVLDQMDVGLGAWMDFLHRRTPCCDPEQFIVPVVAVATGYINRTSIPPYEPVPRYRQVARFEGALPVKLTLAASDLEPWNQQGRLLLQTGEDVLVYDVPSRKLVVELGIAGLAPSFIMGGREIALAIPDPLNPDRPRGPLVIYNAQSGRKTREITAKTPSMVTDYWTLPTGAWAVTMASQYEPQILTSAGAIAIKPGVPTQVSPDLSRVAELGEFHAVNLRDTWPRPRAALRPGVSVRPHQKSINRLRFDASGSRILTASDDGTAKLLDAVTGTVLRTFPHGEALRDARFLADGTRVLTIVRHGDQLPKFAMKLWNAATGQLVGAWRLDVHRLALEGTIAGSGDLWFANTGDAVSLLEATMGTFIGWVGVERADLRSASISPDGRYVAASGSEVTWVWERVE